MPSFAKPRSTTPRLFVWSVWSCVMRTASRFAGSNPASSQRAKKSRLQMPAIHEHAPCPWRYPRLRPRCRGSCGSTCNASRWFIGFASRISSRCLSRPPIVPECAPLAPRIPKRSKGRPEWHGPCSGFSFQNAPRAGGIATDRESTVPPRRPFRLLWFLIRTCRSNQGGRGIMASTVAAFLERKDIEVTFQRYAIDALSAWRRVCSLRFSSAPS